MLPAAVALLVYGLTACRTVYFGDSAELSAAGAVLGIAHPPGYPLYTLLARTLVAGLPGEPALAANLLSVVAAALTAGAAACLARLLGARPVAAIAAGLLVIGSRTIWSQAVVAEVYTLHAFFAVSVLTALAADEHLPRRDVRALLLAAYLFALGLAHHITIAYLALPAAVILAARRRLPVPALPAALGLAALALTLYAALPLRSHFDPPLDWGNPESLPRLLSHVSGRQYQFLVGKMRPSDMLARLGAIGSHFARDLHPFFLAAIVLGLASLRRQPAWLAALGLVVLVLAAHAVAYGIPDYAGHLAPAAVALAVVAALGIDGATRRVRPAPVAGLLVVAAAAAPIALHAAAADRSRHRSAREYAENLLAPLPTGATLFAEGDNQVFLLAYLTAACGARPDLAVIDRDGNLLADFYGYRSESGLPPPRGFHEHRLATEVREIGAWFTTDPARAVFTSSRTNLPEAGPFTQEVEGLVFRLQPRPASGRDSTDVATDPWARIRTGAIQHDTRRGDYLTREVAARYWVRRGEAAFERNDRRAMAAAFDSALAIAPKNADLYSYLGAFYGQNDMLQAAIPLLEKAVHLEPLSVRGWTNLGLALVKSGRRDEGRAALEESLRIQPHQDGIAALVAQLRAR